MRELLELDWATLSDPGTGRLDGSTGSRGAVGGAEFRFLRDLNHFLRNRLCTLEQVFAVAADDLTDSYHMTITLPRIEREMRRIEDTLERSLTMVSPLPPAEFSVDLAEVLARVAERVRVSSERPVSFHLEVPSAPVLVRGHEELAETAFAEVLRNAAEHSGKGEARGVVDIAIRWSKDAPATVTVEHDGTAISPEDREKVFGAFVTQGERSTGLGLPIARRMMNHMGGRLDLVENPEGKLRYRFEFPALHPSSRETSPQSSG
jgi:signal transduction histidine kinase